MTNRQWVTWHILWKAVSSHLFLWSSGSEWHCTFCEMQSHHIFSYDQQQVSDIAHFVKCSRLTHISSYDEQEVSDIAHFVKGSLITSFLMTNSLWVTLHILWMAVSSHLFLWWTGSEWHCTFCERQSHHTFCYPTASEWHCTFSERQSLDILSYDQQQVSDIAHFVTGSLMTSFPITNSKWVTLHILWKAVTWHLFYDQQIVSDIAHFMKACSLTWHLFLLLWPTASEWQVAHFVKDSLITSFPMTNSEWVTLYIL
jgi:hypothetical protein